MSGIPKPLIYCNEFVSRAIRVGVLPPLEGFRSVDINRHPGPFFSTFPLFHVSEEIKRYNSARTTKPLIHQVFNNDANICF